jgi:hypothetical protein
MAKQAEMLAAAVPKKLDLSNTPFGGGAPAQKPVPPPAKVV